MPSLFKNAWSVHDCYVGTVELRVWILVRSFTPLNAIAFDVPLMRFCDRPFDTRDPEDVSYRCPKGSAVSPMTLEDLESAFGPGAWASVVQPQLHSVVQDCLDAVRYSVKIDRNDLSYMALILL